MAFLKKPFQFCSITLSFLLLGIAVGSAPPLEAFVNLDAPTYRNEGYRAQQKHRWTTAIKYYQKAIAIDPFYATPHNDLGIVFEKQGKHERAEAAYLKAIIIDPRFLDPYANIALLYEQAGKPEQAAIYWKKRIEYGHPNDPWTRKAMERLSLLDKEMMTVSYPISPAQKIPSKLSATPLVSEVRERKIWGEGLVPVQKTDEFESFGAIPTELYYTIGAGDTLDISVWQHPDLARVVAVRPDGRISFPLVDDAYVSGLTPEQVDAVLTNEISKTIRKPSVTVIVTGFQSRGVYVLGEVNRPGRYTLTQPTTATEIIARAGQWRDSGVLTSVMVVRRGWTKQPKVYRVNLAKVVKEGDASKDMVLQDGDVVFIPRNFVKKLDNFLSFFTKHLFGTIGGFIGGRPVQIVEPVEIN